MEEEFFARYGVRGEVLPPMTSGPADPVQQQYDERVLVVGFAGSIGHGYEDAFCCLADALEREGGQLVVASPTPRSMMPRIWRHPAVLDLGGLPPDAVRPAFMAAGVNVLAVVQNFDPIDLDAFRLNFPSKLTEYTRFGLPILVVAPKSSSAALWIMRNSDAGILVHRPTINDISAAIQRLKIASERQKLAIGVSVAAAEFDPEVLQRRFEAALLQACGCAS
jgi:hypothetical protein